MVLVGGHVSVHAVTFVEVPTVNPIPNPTFKPTAGMAMTTISRPAAGAGEPRDRPEPDEHVPDPVQHRGGAAAGPRSRGRLRDLHRSGGSTPAMPLQTFVSQFAGTVYTIRCQNGLNRLRRKLHGPACVQALRLVVSLRFGRRFIDFQRSVSCPVCGESLRVTAPELVSMPACV